MSLLGSARKNIYRRLYPGINARITGPFLLVIIVIAGIGVFIVTRLVAGSLQERFNNQLVDSANAASSSLADIEREQLATLRLMVFTEGVPEAIQDNNTGDLDLWLRPVAANARVDDLIIFDDTGQGILQLSRIEESVQYDTPTPPNIKDWPGIQGVLQAQTDEFGDKYIDIVSVPPDSLVYISAPIKDDEGQVVGGISLGIRISRMAREISTQSLSAVVLYDKQGAVLGSTFRLVDPSMLVLPSDHASELAEQTKHNSPIEQVNLNGVPYQVLYSPLKIRSQQIGLLGVGLPTNYIVERISTSRDTFGILFSSLFLLVGMLGLLTARTITRPIIRLVSTTRAIREGDLSRRVGLRTPDELGELAVSFDHMTEQLIERNQEIEGLYLQQLEETARQQAILTGIGDAVIVQDPMGTVLLSNPSANALLQMVSQNQSLRRQFMQLCRQPENLSQPRTVQILERYFNVLATPVSLSSGDLLGHVLVFRDITAIVSAERLKDEMIMQLSHELRTPLSVARGCADLVKTLEQQSLSDQGRTFVQGAIDNLSTLERMVNQVIDVSAIIADRFNIAVHRFNLSELLKSLVQQWYPVVEKRDLELSLSLASEELFLEGDENYIGQVLDHLLRNAYSYTLPGGSIEVYAAHRDSQVVIYVQDTGVGIAPDELEKIFERMYRGRSADAGPTDARGLGLGLYLSKKIIEAHHGTIQIESKINYGTVVTIELPINQDGTG